MRASLYFCFAALLGGASGFAVTPSCASAHRGVRMPAVAMKLSLRVNDMVQVISGDDKVRARTASGRARLRSALTRVRARGVHRVRRASCL